MLDIRYTFCDRRYNFDYPIDNPNNIVFLFVQLTAGKFRPSGRPKAE
jgi:hypothetical protein